MFFLVEGIQHGLVTECTIPRWVMFGVMVLRWVHKECVTRQLILDRMLLMSLIFQNLLSFSHPIKAGPVMNQTIWTTLKIVSKWEFQCGTMMECGMTWTVTTQRTGTVRFIKVQKSSSSITRLERKWYFPFLIDSFAFSLGKTPKEVNITGPGKSFTSRSPDSNIIFWSHWRETWI